MIYKTTAERLLSRMNDLGIKAQDVADRSQINKASISQYLNGKNQPSTRTAMKLSRALGGNPLWYMGFDVPFDYSLDDEIKIKLAKLSEENKRIVLERINTLIEIQEDQK